MKSTEKRNGRDRSSSLADRQAFEPAVAVDAPLSHPGVLVMESAKTRDSDDRSNRLHRTAERGVFVESEMGTNTIVIVGIVPEDLAEMGFAQDHDVIEAFSPDRADEPFDVSVLPGRAGRDWSIPNAHRPNSACHFTSKAWIGRSMFLSVSSPRSSKEVFLLKNMFGLGSGRPTMASGNSLSGE
jgi:hypothetical protein